MWIPLKEEEIDIVKVKGRSIVTMRRSKAGAGDLRAVEAVGSGLKQ